jgi:hypothetical protein
VDGGFDYTKGTLRGAIETVIAETIELDVDIKILYNDWSHGADKFGLIKWLGTQEELEVLQAKALLQS